MSKISEMEVKLICLLEDICEEKNADGDFVHTYHDIAKKIIELFEEHPNVLLVSYKAS